MMYPFRQDARHALGKRGAYTRAALAPALPPPALCSRTSSCHCCSGSAPSGGESSACCAGRLTGISLGSRHITFTSGRRFTTCSRDRDCAGPCSTVSLWKSGSHPSRFAPTRSGKADTVVTKASTLSDGEVLMTLAGPTACGTLVQPACSIKA